MLPPLVLKGMFLRLLIPSPVCEIIECQIPTQIRASSDSLSVAATAVSRFTIRTAPNSILYTLARAERFQRSAGDAAALRSEIGGDAPPI